MSVISIYSVLQIMFPIVFISLLGFIYARLKKAEPQVVSDIIVYLSIPALFFTSFYKHKLVAVELPVIFLTISLVMILTFAVVYILRKAFHIPFGIYLPSIFMNSAFVGFPLVLLAYGDQGLSRAIIYDFFNGLLIFTIGVYIISKRRDLFEVFKMPFLYAAVLGLFFNFAGVDIPQIVVRSIGMIGGITIPLALLMLGFRLGASKIRSLSYPLLVSILRMGLGAAIAWVVVAVLKIDPALGKVLIIMSALPPAFMTLVLAEKYRSETDLISSSIAVSTLLSVVFLPLLIWILK